MTFEGNEAHGICSGHKIRERNYWGEDGSRQPVDHEESGEEWMQRMCQEHGVNLPTFLEIYAAVVNHIGAAGGGGADVAEAVRGAVNKLRELITRTFQEVQKYELQRGNRRMAERCAWLLLDFNQLAGELEGADGSKLVARTCDDLVRLLGQDKATVNKCVQFLQGKLPELPLLPDQRAPESRERMAAVQRRIWKSGGAEKRRVSPAWKQQFIEE